MVPFFRTIACHRPRSCLIVAISRHAICSRAQAKDAGFAVPRKIPGLGSVVCRYCAAKRALDCGA
jgi:hypothetical protein